MELLRNKTHQNVLFPYSQYVLLVMLWLPFLFVFAIDLSVWYAIWTAAVGAFVGVSQKLGEVGLSPVFVRPPLNVPSVCVCRSATSA